ncbi:PEP-CTERM sorting domain-containing protein [Pseudoduganella lutea]|nr:PEP-CTERM sorting domain-containing protein [Pseudoduganella lutea]
MRPFSSTTAALIVTLAMPAAQAATLPSLNVPTFSLAFTDYSGYSHSIPGLVPASIGLLSTDAASTVISLDSLGQTLHTVESGSAAMVAEVYSAIHFRAADGYRITGISFSATVYGVLELPEVNNPDVLWVEYGDSLNFAEASASITSPGEISHPDLLYGVTQVTAPVTLGGNVTNTQGLREFDFDLYVLGSSRAIRTNIYYPNPNPEEPWPAEGRAYGDAEIHYVNPVLTVYTEALVPALAPVPEPGQWAMLLGGLGLMFGARRFVRR